MPLCFLMLVHAPVLPLFRGKFPHSAVQFVEQARIHEEVGFLRAAEFFRTEFQRLFEEGAALFVLFFAEGLFPYAAAHEGNMEGVHTGNDHGAGKAEAAVDEEGAVAVRAFGFLMHIGLFRGFREFGGRDKRPRRRAARPQLTRLVNTESGMEKARPKAMGENHQKKPGLMSHIRPPHTMPSSVPHQWKRMASSQLVPVSSRFCTFQPTFQPRSVVTTKKLWKIMRMGASMVEMSTSASTLMHIRRKPPKCFAPPRYAVSTMAKIFGMKSMTPVLPRRSSAHWGYHVGHTGNSVGAAGK